MGFEKTTLASKWSTTQGQEGRVYAEAQAEDFYSRGERMGLLPSIEEPTSLAWFFPPHADFLLRGPATWRERGSAMSSLLQTEKVNKLEIRPSN